MIKKYIPTLISAILVLVLHLVGMDKELYFHFFWYDILLHFLGGLTIALFLSIFIKNKWLVFWGMIVIAIAWEVFEFYLNIAVDNPNEYIFDTVKDFIMDSLGAALAIFYKRNN